MKWVTRSTGTQVRHGLRMAQRIEKVHCTDDVEQPDQRRRSSPATPQSDEHEHGEHTRSQIPVRSGNGEAVW